MTKWKVAAYIRISREVGADRRESNTLENQKSIIDGYFENELDYEIIDYYVDDGYTGTDFNRPFFQKLLDDIFSKKINAVIVKDLSRFGRNYARMGIYLGEVFPYRNVRFISVIDEIDSLYDPYYYDEIDFPIKNVIHEQYSKDVSIKTKTAKMVQRERGEYMGVSAPYGYIKNPENKNDFLIDKDAANIVRLIYKMTLEGKSKSEIRDLLNEKEILTPSEYKSKVTKVTSDRTIIVSKWNNEMIGKILRNETYIGTLIQGKFRRETFKIHRLLKNEEKEWTKIENHHKPIIEKNDFETVQKILDFPNTFVRKNEYLLPYLRCNCCEGEFLVKKAKNIEYYYCKKYYRKKLCVKNSVPKNILEGIVLEELNTKFNLEIRELTKEILSEKVDKIYVINNGGIKIEYKNVKNK